MRLLLSLLPVLGFVLSAQAEPTVRLAGSTTAQGAIEHRLAEIQANAGCKIELNGNGSVAGLASLAQGRADLAMISSPFLEVVQKLNEKTPGTIDPTAYRAETIGLVRIVFVVNPRNPLRSLTAAQLAALLMGQVKNWREVGGADMPVLIVSLANSGSIVQARLLGGAPISPSARLVSNANQIAPLVAQEAGAIGIISAAHTRGKTSVLAIDTEIQAPLALVTKGAADPVQQRLIQAVRRELGDSG